MIAPDPTHPGLSVDTRALYSIQIQGTLDPHWSERMNGVKIVNSGFADGGTPTVTTLIGEVIDQAALAGILNTVYMLGYPLLSVTYLGRSS